MNCEHAISYIIRPGDNLFQLARYYQTSVESILTQNPGLDPYNLTIGTSIIICVGELIPAPFVPAMSPAKAPSAADTLSNQMRNVWEQHVFWTRALIVSTLARLKDESETAARLLRNPKDFAAIYSAYYPKTVTNTIEQLLTEHLEIGGKLMAAMRDGKTTQASRLNHEWYQNAHKIAEAFAAFNPHYDEKIVEKMMDTHLDLLTKDIEARLGGQYKLETSIYDSVEAEALNMADYFTQGIQKQFLHKR